MQQPPLAGVRVLEVGNYMAGPFCGMQLADLGADVIKVEDPRGGDLSRRLEPITGGESGNFVRLNRSKRSVALDLKAPAAKEVFRRLSSHADVIVENLRPGTMADLGLAPRDLLDANPRLIYAAVTGWGLNGPYADRPALDIIVQAMSGLMSVTGEPGRAPAKVGVSISDLAADEGLEESREIAASRVLDLHDVGAEVRELHAAERPGHVVADLEGAHTAERRIG